MDPNVVLIFQVVGALLTVLVNALSQNDWSVFDRPVKDILPFALKTTIARRRAEAEAEAKFPIPDDPYKEG